MMTKVLMLQYMLGIYLLITKHVNNSNCHVTQRWLQVAPITITVSDIRLLQLVEGKSLSTFCKCSSCYWRTLLLLVVVVVVVVVFLVLVLVVVKGF
jgi:hypothetical protein